MNAACRTALQRQLPTSRRWLAYDRSGGAGRHTRDWPPLDFGVPPKPRAAMTLKELPAIGPDDPYYKSLRDPDYFGVSDLFTVRQLMEARVHLGHKVGTLSDKMKPFLLGERLGVCIFDLDQTAEHLRVALNFIAHMAYRSGIIVFFGGDSWNIHSIEQAAKEVGEFSHCRRFVAGTLIDSKRMFGSVIRYPDLGIFCTTTESTFKQHEGTIELSKLSVPSVGVVDSNCDPDWVTYPIPGNDDSPTTIRFYLQLFKEAIRKGKEKAKADFPELTSVDSNDKTQDERRRDGVAK